MAGGGSSYLKIPLFICLFVCLFIYLYYLIYLFIFHLCVCLLFRYSSLFFVQVTVNQGTVTDCRVYHLSPEHHVKKHGLL